MNVFAKLNFNENEYLLLFTNQNESPTVYLRDDKYSIHRYTCLYENKFVQ